MWKLVSGQSNRHPLSWSWSQDSQVKLALSRRLCGLLIGHKGQTVRDFITDSGSAIRVQSLSELTPSDPERTITVSGARDQVLRAVALILNTVSDFVNSEPPSTDLVF